MKKKVVVNLYWIRHAYSCANILKKRGLIAKSLKSVVTIDPALTDIGVEQAKKLNDVFNSNTLKISEKFDIVLSSNLRRAMETAMYAFSDIKNSNDEPISIYVVPHISEARNPLASSLNIDKENAPLPVSELKKTYDVMKSEGTDFNTNVKFELIQELDPDSKLKPDYEKFIKNVLPKVLDLLPEKTEYNIAIVSHSHFITQHILATENQKKTNTKYRNLARNIKFIYAY